MKVNQILSSSKNFRSKHPNPIIEMSAFKNEAAWIMTEKAKELEVREGPVPNPTAEEVVIKVAYAAVNPTDWKASTPAAPCSKSNQSQMQDHPFLNLSYPFIFGTDVSGTVAQVGSTVTKFKVGQRVIGHCDGLISLNATRAGFQLYSTCRERVVSAVPDSLPLANAVVLPLGVDTAATGLYHVLKLPLPLLNPESTGKTILIWGGASSCGSSAIQLAVASGLRVITTAGKANFDYVKSLGASEAFDYRVSGVVDELKTVMKEGDLVFDCVGTPDAQIACAEILSSIGGSCLPMVLQPEQGLPGNLDVQPGQ
jgi:NADPH:quinone reductase-like Zn-dependent oxidoreductase